MTKSGPPAPKTAVIINFNILTLLYYYLTTYFQLQLKQVEKEEVNEVLPMRELLLAVDQDQELTRTAPGTVWPFLG